MTPQELFDSLDIPAISEGHEHTRRGWLQLDCPFCNQPDHWRLGFNIRGCYFHCWACGPLSIANVLMEVTGKGFREIRTLLDKLDRDEIVSPDEIKPQGKLVLPDGLSPLLKPHKSYLRERGFSPKRLTRIWGLQGIGLAPDLAWRIFIPITYRGKIVSWTTRSLTKQGRYRSAGLEQESIPHKELLYGEEYAGHSVIVCEGPADVWSIGPGAVATFGISYTSSQAARISKYSRRILCYDAEPEAQRKARELADELAPFSGDTLIVTLDSGKDPGEASEKELRQLRRMLK